MIKFLFWTSSFITLLFWPTSFWQANSKSWIIFALASAVLGIDWLLTLYKVKYRQFIYLLLPLIHPVYLMFPIFATIAYAKDLKKVSLSIYIFLLIAVSAISYKAFYAYSIFTPDPLAFDTLSKKISLVPSRTLARVFENKTTIFQEKYKANIFSSLDLNNYFFSNHPREIGGNQNLLKFPYFGIIPFLVGLYFIAENKNKKWILSTLLLSVFSVAFINNQDRFDSILYFPILLITLYGLRKISNSKTLFLLFSVFFIPISIIELSKILILK